MIDISPSGMRRGSPSVARRLARACASQAARPPALWLRLRNTPIFDALRIEEALFRADRRSWLITNEWDAEGGECTATGETLPPSAATAIVLGISGKADKLVHLEAARAAGVPLCRRFTGGGTVVVDTSTLFVTFLAAAEALPEVRPYPEPILRWTSDVYADALDACGIDEFATHANDYCIGRRKFGGVPPAHATALGTARVRARLTAPQLSPCPNPVACERQATRSPFQASGGSTTRRCYGRTSRSGWPC
jgi:hypothetical protein